MKADDRSNQLEDFNVREAADAVNGTIESIEYAKNVSDSKS
jgi:hypothetical protein